MKIKVKCDVYGWTVHFLSGPRKRVAKAANRIFKRENGSASENPIKASEFRDNDGMAWHRNRTTVIYLEDPSDVAILAHEVHHAVARILTWCSMPQDYENSEAGAILTGHIVGEYAVKAGLVVSRK